MNVIRADECIGQINPNIYDYITEHLGSSVYDGIWVGPDSNIPNGNGIRLDVVGALKKIIASKMPRLRGHGNSTRYRPNLHEFEPFRRGGS